VKRLTLLALLLAAAAPAQEPSNFAGDWDTTFGRMSLTQDGKKVTGFYTFEGQRCPVKGEVVKNRLTFTYEEPTVKGEGWFERAGGGKSFAGKWRPEGGKGWDDWTGARVEAPGFGGVWSTTYGQMRLAVADGRVRGVYGPGGASTIDGKIEGKRFVFRYQELDAAGEGWFELAQGAKSLTGKWRKQGAIHWRDWKGSRVEPTPGRQWLVVLEANWEGHLAEQEYAFGSMLRAFFARSGQVQVRHRFFNDADSLTRWCREVAYLPDPVVLVIATHGTPKGVTVGGKTVGARELADGLRHCDNLKLLHFSACAIMKDKLAAEIVRNLEGRAAFPLSGYTNIVDWAASAVIEFTYFDLILLRGMAPKRAADQLPKLLPFSGDKPIPGGALPPAGFRFVEPGGVVSAGK
jgi:hypothetical protein